MRPSYAQYGRRGVVWCSFPENEYPLTGNSEFELLIPEQGSQWRQDRVSSFNSIDRHAIYFVPKSQRRDAIDEKDKGTMYAYTLRDLWEEFQIEHSTESYMTGFDFATGAALGEYRKDWSDATWVGTPLYVFRADFLQSFSPALALFSNQTDPRWSRVTKGNSGPIEDDIGQPAYLTLHVDAATGEVMGANETIWYKVHDDNFDGTRQGILLHATDAPANTDFAKVLLMSDPILVPPQKRHAYRVDLTALPNIGGIRDARSLTDTWMNLKPFILHNDTGVPIEDGDIT